MLIYDVNLLSLPGIIDHDFLLSTRWNRIHPVVSRRPRNGPIRVTLIVFILKVRPCADVLTSEPIGIGWEIISREQCGVVSDPIAKLWNAAVDPDGLSATGGTIEIE